MATLPICARLYHDFSRQSTHLSSSLVPWSTSASLSLLLTSQTYQIRSARCGQTVIDLLAATVTTIVRQTHILSACQHSGYFQHRVGEASVKIFTASFHPLSPTSKMALKVRASSLPPPPATRLGKSELEAVSNDWSPTLKRPSEKTQFKTPLMIVSLKQWFLEGEVNKKSHRQRLASV